MIRVTGTATLRCNATGETIHVNADQVDFEQVGGGERGMGSEMLYAGEAESEFPSGEVASVRWEVSEYPVETLNHVTHTLEGCSLVHDLNISIDHQPDGPEEE